ncbi:hypothetical protein B0T25DRAFT_531157 [Lasiosphaeria hispida]|uniref:Uncharacterized protein n=1 Tax=Lasiosphaeria hispida TaxID=260671 RepID=A0AAJ0HNZ7_9PEZI|nr:hypothetical protein B0T25DRAFT_531157 [Lasiosphaeria hispida]
MRRANINVEGSVNGELDSSQSRRGRITSNYTTAPSPVSLSQSPEPSSINNILRNHSRDRLYIPPLQWTAQHLDLLGCRFVRNKAPRLTGEGHRVDLSAQTALSLLANRLLHPSITEFKTTVIRLHLKDHNIIYRRSDLLFNFGSRPVIKLPTNGVFSLSGTDSAAPVMAYLDLEAVRSRRNASIKVSGDNRPNPPIAGLRQKIQRRLNPIKEAEDPYIAAVLVALAQAAARDSPVPATSQDEKVAPEATTKVYLLARPSDTQGLYFYKAQFSPAFLDRLDMPSRYFPSRAVKISYYLIPLSPTRKLAQAMDYTISVIHGVTRPGGARDVENPNLA